MPSQLALKPPAAQPRPSSAFVDSFDVSDDIVVPDIVFVISDIVSDDIVPIVSDDIVSDIVSDIDVDIVVSDIVVIVAVPGRQLRGEQTNPAPQSAVVRQLSGPSRR